MEESKTIPFNPYQDQADALDKITDPDSLSEADRARYDQSLKVYRDNMAVLTSAENKGRREGLEEVLKEVARNMKIRGMDDAMIADVTGLSPDQINAL